MSGTNDAEHQPQKNSEPPYPPAPYAWYVVLVLMIIYIFSFIDRQILALLVTPIRAHFAISDTQMSLLMGFTFALFYTFFGIPIGRIADSRSRRGLIAIGLIFWSIMTAGCGLASRYWHLLLCRIGVGVGEATLSPAAYSMITDYFPPKRLSLAISVYAMGIYIGSGMAYLLGGYIVAFAARAENLSLPLLGTIQPWQLVFFAVGLPGVLLSLALLTVREPLRRGHGGSSVPMRNVLQYLAHNWAAFSFHSIAYGLIALVGYGAFSWVPAYLTRVHAAEPAQIGQHFGFSVMIFGSAGIVAGGFLADFLRARGYTDSNIRVGVLSGALSAPLSLLYFFAETFLQIMIAIHILNFLLAMASGTAPAAIQQMMPNAMRGQAAALYLFIVNLIGLGLGPTAVALFTDYVFKGDEFVGYSLAVVGAAGAALATLFFLLALAPFRNSLDYLEKWRLREGH